MKKYVKIEWPEIQDYMSNPEYNEECYFDPRKNCWFIPDTWEPDIQYEEPKLGTKEYFDLHDCYDAIGGDWEG